MGNNANWYPDPMGRHELRYWDGNQWTDHVADAGQVAKDPLLSAGGSGDTANWQPDPMGRHELRFWDGHQWTDHVADAGQVAKDPLSAPRQPVGGPDSASSQPLDMENSFTWSWQAVQAVCRLAQHDQVGAPLTETTGAPQRGVAVVQVVGLDERRLRHLACGLADIIVGLINAGRFSIDEAGQVMGVPERVRGDGPAASAMNEIFNTEQPRGATFIGTATSLSEISAWYATMLCRFERMSRIDPLPDP